MEILEPTEINEWKLVIMWRCSDGNLHAAGTRGVYIGESELYKEGYQKIKDAAQGLVGAAYRTIIICKCGTTHELLSSSD